MAHLHGKRLLQQSFLFLHFIIRARSYFLALKPPINSLSNLYLTLKTPHSSVKYRQMCYSDELFINNSSLSIIEPVISNRKYLFGRDEVVEDSPYLDDLITSNDPLSTMERQGPTEYRRGIANDNESTVIESVDSFRFRIDMDQIENALLDGSDITAMQSSDSSSDKTFQFSNKLLNYLQEGQRISDDSDNDVIRIEMDEDEFIEMLLSQRRDNSEEVEEVDDSYMAYDELMMQSAREFLQQQSYREKDNQIPEFNQKYPKTIPSEGKTFSSPVLHKEPQFLRDGNVVNQSKQFWHLVLFEKYEIIRSFIGLCQVLMVMRLFYYLSDRFYASWNRIAATIISKILQRKLFRRFQYRLPTLFLISGLVFLAMKFVEYSSSDERKYRIN